MHRWLAPPFDFIVKYVFPSMFFFLFFFFFFFVFFIFFFFLSVLWFMYFFCQLSSPIVKSQSVRQSICQSLTRLLGYRPCFSNWCHGFANISTSRFIRCFSWFENLRPRNDITRAKKDITVFRTILVAPLFFSFSLFPTSSCVARMT